MSVPQVLARHFRVLTTPRSRRALPLGMLALLVVACGSRGPLDLGPIDLDAGGDVDVPDVGEPDTAPPPKDAGKEAAPTIVDCGLCIAQSCGQPIFMCLQSVPCRTVLTCVTQKCLAGGMGPDPVCLIMCSGGDPQGALEALGVLQCLTAKCGTTCGGVLPGGPGRPPRGQRQMQDSQRAQESVDEVFSRWPELTSHAK